MVRREGELLGFNCELTFLGVIDGLRLDISL